MVKGKSAIVVPSLDKLPTIIDTLIAAVRNGELDTQLAQACAQTKIPNSKGVQHEVYATDTESPCHSIHVLRKVFRRSHRGGRNALAFLSKRIAVLF